MSETQAATGHRLLGLLLLATAAVMAPALWGEFVYDDIPLVVQNPRVHDLTAALFEPLWGQEFAYWRPLAGLMMAISLATGGAAVLHGFALLIHLAAVTVSFVLARRLTGSVHGGLFTATLFALHPVQVESVAWGSAVQDPLVGLMVLCSLLAMTRWRLAGSRGFPIWTIAAYATALLAKETAVVALPALWMLDHLLRQGLVAPEKTITTTPKTRQLGFGLAACVLAYGLARVWVFGSPLAGWDRAQLDPTFAGVRLWTAPVEVLGQFARLTVLPWPLSPFRDVAVETSAGQFLGHAIWLVLPLGLLFWAWRTRRPLALFGLVLATLPILVPALRFHAIGAFPIADRYLYWSIFGIGLALAPRQASRPHLLALLVLVPVFVVLNSLQIPTWRSESRLIEHGLQLLPSSPNLLTMRGNELLRSYQTEQDARQLDAAQRAFDAAIANSRRPTDRPAEGWRGLHEDAMLGLAWCELLRQQRQPQPQLDTAIRLFQASVKTTGAPANAWIGLGISYGSAGQLRLAEPALTRAVAMAPTNDRAHYNLGFLFAQTQRRRQAIEHLEIAVRLQPANQGAVRLLAQLR